MLTLRKYERARTTLGKDLMWRWNFSWNLFNGFLEKYPFLTGVIAITQSLQSAPFLKDKERTKKSPYINWRWDRPRGVLSVVRRWIFSTIFTHNALLSNRWYGNKSQRCFTCLYSRLESCKTDRRLSFLHGVLSYGHGNTFRRYLLL